MKKVLVIGMTENPGGVESFLVNYCLNTNMKDIAFDFLSLYEQKVAYEDRIKEKHDVFHIVATRKNPIVHRLQLEDFFRRKAGEYAAVWANLCALSNIDFLYAAKKYGIKRIIVHSHNSENMNGAIHLMLHNHHRKRIDRIATDYWACSQGAAEWFYPGFLLPEVKQIKNAIKVDEYSFDMDERMRIREEFSLTDRFVVGHIGRLHFQKNQSFLLDIMRVLIEKDGRYRLVLIGAGPDEAALKEKAGQLQIEDKVLFMGVRDDVGEWLSAFDVFAFPSVFEGLSIVGLEAQANGIPIVASTDAICDEGLINTNVCRLSLDEPDRVWAEAIDGKRKEPRESKEAVMERFREKRFDIDEEARRLSEVFRGMS